MKAPRTLSGAMSVGIVSVDVVTLQEFLNDSGYVVAPAGAGSPGNETTYFGQGTANALKRFQEAHASELITPYGLTRASGAVDQATLRKINQMLNDDSDEQ